MAILKAKINGVTTPLTVISTDLNKKIQATLNVDGWDENRQQTIESNEIFSEGWIYMVAPASEDFDKYGKSLVRALDVVADGEMTFEYGEDGDTPEEDIEVIIGRIKV